MPLRKVLSEKIKSLLRFLAKSNKTSSPITGAKNIPLLLSPTESVIKLVEVTNDLRFRLSRILTALKVRRQNRASVQMTLKKMPAGLYKKNNKPNLTIIRGLCCIIDGVWGTPEQHFSKSVLRMTLRSAAATRKANLLMTIKNAMAAVYPNKVISP